MDTIEIVLSIVVGLAAIAGVVLIFIIILSPPKQTTLMKWKCQHGSTGPNAGVCIRDPDGTFDTEEECNNTCYPPCNARPDKNTCEKLGDCNWSPIPAPGMCYACSDLDGQRDKCFLSPDCAWNPPPSPNSTIEGTCVPSDNIPCSNHTNKDSCFLESQCVWNGGNNACVPKDDTFCSRHSTSKADCLVNACHWTPSPLLGSKSGSCTWKKN